MLPNQRGVALAVAVFALALIGAIVAGNFCIARLEQQSGRAMFFLTQASEAAEAGLAGAIARTPATTFEAMPVRGLPHDLGVTTIAPSVAASGQISRITSTLFFVRVLGVRRDAAGNALATRSVGAILHLGPESAPGARLTERGWLQLY